MLIAQGGSVCVSGCQEACRIPGDHAPAATNRDPAGVRGLVRQLVKWEKAS